MSNDSARSRQGDIAFQQKLYADPNPTRRWLHLTRRAWIEDHLADALKPGDKVLEVGIGCGVFTRFLSNKNVDIVAVDINQAFLDGVADVNRVQVRNADATYDLGYRDVDVALCSEVLEHVPRERSLAMLRQFATALKPGGLLILTTPQKYATVELMARLFKFRPILALARLVYGTAEELEHINLLTREQLIDQIKQAGFAIEEEQLLGFYLPVIAEFGGKPGVALLKATSRVVGRVAILKNLLWTQAYQLRKVG